MVGRGWQVVEGATREAGVSGQEPGDGARELAWRCYPEQLRMGRGVWGAKERGR